MTIEEAKKALYDHINWNLGMVRGDGSFPNCLPEKQVENLIQVVHMNSLAIVFDGPAPKICIHGYVGRCAICNSGTAA